MVMGTVMSVLTSTERWSRTRLRVARGSGDGPSVVRSVVSASDDGAPALRPMILARQRDRVRVSLVPEGALLLAGDGIELDIAVDDGAFLELVEPGGTVAFDMRGGCARWSVRVQLGRGARMTWAGEPFVVSAGADVERKTLVRLAAGARLALRETLVLGRYGELPGHVRVTTSVVDDSGPLQVEDLPLNPGTAPGLLGGHRVVASVLLVGDVGVQPDERPDLDRYDLHSGGTLWRRLGAEAHAARLDGAWLRSRSLVAGDDEGGTP